MYHWEEEEKKRKKKRRRSLNGESIKTSSKNGSRDQFNKFMYYGIKKLSDIGLKFGLHVEYQLYLKVISAIVLISAFSRTF